MTTMTSAPVPVRIPAVRRPVSPFGVLHSVFQVATVMSGAVHSGKYRDPTLAHGDFSRGRATDLSQLGSHRNQTR